MKKRIKDSEIEKAKVSNKILLILTMLMVMVVVLGFGFYVFYDKEIIDFGNKKEESQENIYVKNESDFDVNIDNVEVKRLFDIVRVTNNNCDGYNNKDSVKVDELNNKCKYSIASNIYERFIKENSVSENDVKYGYESLFGEGEYKRQESIVWKNNELYYDSINKNYVLNKNGDVDDSLISYEKVISIKKSSNYLYINSVVLYFDKVNNVLCSDYDCSKVLENMSNEPNYPQYYDLYIEHNKKKLNNYKYKFRLDKNGFYKYVSYEKNK